MRKLLFVLIIAIVFLGGCGSNGSTNSGSFDNSNLKEEIASEPYQPKLPTELPFKVESASFEPAINDVDNETILNFKFLGENKAMELMTVNGKSIEDESVNETVDIEGIKGEYGEVSPGNGQTIKILIWKDDGIVYKLSAGTTESKDIKKEEFIETASSFE
ncbi:DUF4367 domain-containing protein [Salimicrobium flavidum]|uniref:Uncharacterized protein n=1 Tax=Salimicrobium flavidum TaxID=570947 RepID=A0A1N7J263_9BACI|nr:DUF4367 domain-containing protein [Salimicrobium flavidum]SIS43445.1 protein of unknown function [Salimicrobium flavidum]